MKDDRPIIGVVTARASESEQQSILSGILSQADELGFNTAVISNIYNYYEYFADVEVENKIYELLESKRLDGLILTAESFTNMKFRDYLYSILRKLEIPIVVTGDSVSGFTCVDTDVRADFYDIAAHAADVHGFTDIHVITGQEIYETSLQRVAGVRDALAERGIELPQENVIYGNFWTDSGEKLALEYIEGKRKLPQAIICANDYMAYGIIDTFFNYDISIPADVSIIGYEFVGERIYHSPLLSTYFRNRNALGAKAIRLLYNKLTGNELPDIPTKGYMVCGDTCPCGVDKKYLGSELKTIQTIRFFESIDMNGNFAHQMSLSRSIDEFIRSLQDFSYLINNVSGIYLCLYENWCSRSEKTPLDVNSNNEIMTMYRIISPVEVPSSPHFFRRGMMFPDGLCGSGDKNFLYFIPMFSAGTEIGYFILEFSSPCTYDKNAVDWVNSAVKALNVLKMKNDIKELLTCNNLSEFHDSMTGMYNRSGFFHEIENTISRASQGNSICIVIIKTGLFADDSRIDEREMSVRIEIEIAENLKKLSSGSGIFCGRLPEKQFALAIVGDLAENCCEELKNRAITITAHSPMYKSNRKKDSVTAVGITMPISDYDQKKASAELTELLNRKISDSADKRKIKDYDRYQKLRTDMYRFPERSWDADGVCRDLILSSGHFRAAYKNIFNVSFHRDLIVSRTEQAKYLLITTTLSLSAIALKCGYDDDKYFLRQFRQMTGISPNNYRNYNYLSDKAIPK